MDFYLRCLYGSKHEGGNDGIQYSYLVQKGLQMATISHIGHLKSSLQFYILLIMACVAVIA